ncbi:MAG: PEGA domain-containing protein [Phycisphaerales bacterium]|nr:PEGA domain-containing protein [Phycisphaerales bacterium]
MSRAKGLISMLAVAAMAAVLPGCLERRLSITSEPPGALVWVNDVELGRTPVEADFTFYGEYDVRLQLDGYEPIQKRMTASQPLHEYPPFDLVAGALPVDFENVVKWHFDLQPALEQSQTPEEFEKGLLERARGTREKLVPAEEAKAEEAGPVEPTPPEAKPEEAPPK